MKTLGIAISIAAILVVGITFFSPTTGQDRTSERLTELETRVTALETLVASESDPIDAAAAAAHTLTGTFLLYGGPDGIDLIYGPGKQTCIGEGGYADIHEGASVRVTNEAGVVIAVGSLGAGESPSLWQCQFAFEVSKVPQAAFYTIEVSHRGGLTYSWEELEHADWQVELFLGDG
ncbi:MAG: hypothetical protein KF883_10185 [Thermomicrobiales bacterium]|nr:hypothetical protein [Thermomicrobiales bacterium]